MEIIEIKLSKIKTNEYNPNTMSEAMLEHLKEEFMRAGYLQPILVRPKEDYYEIVDGEHRFRAYEVLNQESIPCIVKEMSDTEAKLTTINFNQIRGELEPIRMAKLLLDLNKSISSEDIDRILKISKSEQEAYQLLLTIPEDYSDMTKIKQEIKEFVVCPNCNTKINLNEAEVVKDM